MDLIDDSDICLKLAHVLNCKVEMNDLWQYQRRELIWQKLQYLWQNEEPNSEQLEEVSLIISGLGFLPYLRNNFQNMSAEHVADFGKAPEDELIRWRRFRQSVKQMNLTEFKHSLREEFPIQEVLYPFVKNIVVQLNVSKLRDKNICIIDTPGLGANSKDTSAAMRAVQRADAILYILGGNKEPGEFERQFLYDLHAIIKNRPVIFAVNCQKKERLSVMESIAEVLKICGYDNPNLNIYNAALALRMAQGIKIMEPRPLRSLVKSLISRAKREGFNVSNAAQAWTLLTAKDMSAVSKKDSKVIDKFGLCNESIEILKAHSNLIDLVYRIKSENYLEE